MHTNHLEVSWHMRIASLLAPTVKNESNINSDLIKLEHGVGRIKPN